MKVGVEEIYSSKFKYERRASLRRAKVPHENNGNIIILPCTRENKENARFFENV